MITAASIKPLHLVCLCLVLSVAAHVMLWNQVRLVQSEWSNVPPAPSTAGATLGTLGDKAFAYRTIGLMLQNIGDTGGRTTNLGEYDYDALEDWFILENTLDPNSNYIPFLASYYFGAVDDKDSIKPVINYLEHIGYQDRGQAWRWLARAAFLARYTQQDQDRALELANKLASMQTRVDLPIWAREMPLFILHAKGEHQAAQAIIEETLKSEIDTLHPNEINFLIDYLCNRILDADQAKAHPFCHKPE